MQHSEDMSTDTGLVTNGMMDEDENKEITAQTESGTVDDGKTLQNECQDHQAVDDSKSSNTKDTNAGNEMQNIVIKQEPIDDEYAKDDSIKKINEKTESTEKVAFEICHTNECNVLVDKESHVEAVAEFEASKAENSLIRKKISDQENTEGGVLEDTANLHDEKVGLDNPSGVEMVESHDDLTEISDTGKDEITENSGSHKITNASTETDNNSPDVIVLEGPSGTEYRNTKDLITVDSSSDSSPDSSDSEDDSDCIEKKNGGESTENQINKIISNEREESPDREKRVKLNRYGFEDIRTKGELLPEELPPLEELTITVDESVEMREVGTIKSIVGILVVIQSGPNIPALDDETILFVEGHKVLGQVFEVFGPVKTPWYSVRFNDAENINLKGIKVGMPVYCAPKEDSFTKFVFVDHLKNVRGSDASWEDNNEPPEKHLDYSDDEAERHAKLKRRNKKPNENGNEEGNEDDTVNKKNRRNRNRNRAQRGQVNQTGSKSTPSQSQQHGQQARRPMNPFQENGNSRNTPQQLGSRQQNHINSNETKGHGWPPNQRNFNSPPASFGGPPNFHSRPRWNQPQQSMFPGRMPQQRMNWIPPNANMNRPDYGHNAPNMHQSTVRGPPPVFSSQTPPPPGRPADFQNRPSWQPNIDTSRPPPNLQSSNQFPWSDQLNRPRLPANSGPSQQTAQINGVHVPSPNQNLNSGNLNPCSAMMNQGPVQIGGSMINMGKNFLNNSVPEGLSTFHNTSSSMTDFNGPSGTYRNNARQQPQPSKQFFTPNQNPTMSRSQEQCSLPGQNQMNYNMISSFSQNSFNQQLYSGHISESGKFPVQPCGSGQVGNNMQQRVFPCPGQNVDPYLQNGFSSNKPYQNDCQT